MVLLALVSSRYPSTTATMKFNVCTFILVSASIAIQQAGGAPTVARDDSSVETAHEPENIQRHPAWHSHHCASQWEQTHRLSRMLFQLLESAGVQRHRHHDGHPSRVEPFAVMGTPSELYAEPPTSGEGRTSGKGRTTGDGEAAAPIPLAHASAHHGGTRYCPGYTALALDAHFATHGRHGAHAPPQHAPFLRRIKFALRHLGRGPALAVSVVLMLGLFALLRTGAYLALGVACGVWRHGIALGYTVRFRIDRYRGIGQADHDSEEVCDLDVTEPPAYARPGPRYGDVPAIQLRIDRSAPSAGIPVVKRG
ncbi:hypothetical protein B0H21DRAFT_890045 [Amylocystis lapponica]|nr:hypothetical protein B0H21DRAFT_890045 [Amylocystis lapponica]